MHEEATVGKPAKPALAAWLLRANLWLERHFPLLAVAPAVIILLVTTIFPLLFALYNSSFEYYLPQPDLRQFIGLANYVTALQDPAFLASLRRTGVLIVGGIALQFLFGLVIALILSDEEVRGRKVLTTLIAIPMMIPEVAAAYMWWLLYRVQGLLNYVLGWFGVGPSLWIAGPSTALFSIMLTDTWQWSPFVGLVLLAGMASIPVEIHEAAAIDGASWFQHLTLVTLPMLKRVIVVILLIRSMDIFKMFGLVLVMTQGGPGDATMTATYYAYLNGFAYFKVGYGAALSFIILSIIVILSTALVSYVYEERAR